METCNSTKKYLSESAWRVINVGCDKESTFHLSATADEYGGKVILNGKIVYDSHPR